MIKITSDNLTEPKKSFLGPKSMKRQRRCKIKVKSSCLMILIYFISLTPVYLLSAKTIQVVSDDANPRKIINTLNTTPPPEERLSTSPSSSTNKTQKTNHITTHLSTVAESGITFISVFLFGCVIILSVYSWKKFADSSWRYVYCDTISTFIMEFGFIIILLLFKISNA